MASHGYVVFALNHNDGTCSYTEKSDGDSIKFARSNSRENFIKTEGYKFIGIRTKEIDSLIDEIGGENFLYNTLGFPKNVTLNMDTLTVMGHSYGGCTIINATAKNEKIKACCPMEATFGPFHKSIDSLIVKDTPLFHIKADNYAKHHGDDLRKVYDKYFFKVRSENFKI